MGAASVALKFGSMVFRVVQFAAAIVILGIFSYFLVYLQHNNLPILQWVRAVEGISGAAALYTLIAFVLVCCLGGVPVFAFVGIVLDLIFAACFIALAVLTDGGNTNCSALQAGDSGLYSDPDQVVNVDQATAQRICELFKATFVISIIEIILFLLSAIFQLFMGRAHQREKRKEAASSAGPAAGGRGRFWRRNRQREMQQGAVSTY